MQSIEFAVKATIRQVTQPQVRQALWDAWQEAIAAASADSPEAAMPWEKATAVTAITEQAAHLALVRTLEAVTNAVLRCRIRDILALECEFTEPEEGAEGIRRYCQHCGSPTGPQPEGASTGRISPRRS